MRRRAAIAVAALLATLTACAVTPEFPDGVSVLVYQPRPDVAAGRLAIQVANAGRDPVDVIGARLVAPAFADDVVWPDDSATVRPGLRLDLRAPVPTFDCDASTDAEVVAELEVATASGVARGTLPVDDPYGLLARLRAEGCVGAQIAAIATVTPRDVIVPTTREPAVLVLDIAPTGAAGAIEVLGVRGTTLLQPVADGVSTPELELGVVLSATGPTELRVPFVPNRCDAHALAEDKVGTIIPFVVNAGEAEPARWMIVLPDALKGEFYRYFEEYCGL